MLNSSENEIYHAHKYYDVNKLLTFQHFIKASESLKVRKVIIFSIFLFISSGNFMLTWVEHETSFYNLGASS